MEKMPETAVEKTILQSIPIDQIKPSPFQTRKTFDDASLNELAQSIKTEGLIQPIIVRASADGRYEVIVGERRLRAAKLLGWAAIDAIVRPGVSNQDAALKGVIENLQRVDLNPLERAQGYKRLADNGLSQEQIAEKAGLSDHNTVSRYMLLLDLPPEIQELLPRGRISEGHTRFIRQIADKTKQIKLAQQADKEGWSVKEIEKRVNAALGKPTKDGSGKSSSHAPSHLGSPAPHPTLPDPLADIWAPILSNTDISPKDSWGVSFKGADTWAFWSKAPSPYSLGALAVWFQRMGQALETEVRRQQTEMAAASAKTDIPAAQAPISDAQSTRPDIRKPRLPQTPQEEKELLEIAIKGGPKAVYAWIYGADSPMTKAVPFAAWEEAGMDPISGLRQILEGIRKFQGVAAKVATIPTPPEPSK